MSFTHRARSTWGGVGKTISLRCAGCGWHTNRAPADDGYGACARCGSPLQRFPSSAFSEKRIAQAKADLERMGR